MLCLTTGLHYQVMVAQCVDQCLLAFVHRKMEPRCKKMLWLSPASADQCRLVCFFASPANKGCNHTPLVRLDKGKIWLFFEHFFTLAHDRVGK